MQLPQSPMAVRGRQWSSGHHLKLIQYRPRGGEPHVCAAIWREGDHVHLAAPLLRTRGGVRDPRSYVRQFPDGLGSINAFEDTMTWLEAECYAATDPREVEAACQQHPEWHLRCTRYDGGDAALMGLTGLIRAAERGSPLPESIVRDCLLELMKQIFKREPALAGAQLDKTSRDGDDVASLDLGPGRKVLVTVLRNVAATDLVRAGLLAHHRMMDDQGGWTLCLLVLPDLDIEQPMFLTSRVAITNMDPDHMRASLVHAAKA